MSNVKVKDRQTLLDIAIQETGALQSVFDIATKNGKSITNALQATEELKVPTDLKINVANLESYKRTLTFPATGGEAEGEGINYDNIPNEIY